MDKVQKARRLINDARMRRGLAEFLWQFREEDKGVTPQPFPMMGDDQIKDELKRILCHDTKKKWWVREVFEEFFKE